MLSFKRPISWYGAVRRWRFETVSHVWHKMKVCYLPDASVKPTMHPHMPQGLLLILLGELVASAFKS